MLFRLDSRRTMELISASLSTKSSPVTRSPYRKGFRKSIMPPGHPPELAMLSVAGSLRTGRFAGERPNDTFRYYTTRYHTSRYYTLLYDSAKQWIVNRKDKFPVGSRAQPGTSQQAEPGDVFGRQEGTNGKYQEAFYWNGRLG